MGLFNLSRFCTAVFFTAALAPALAADPPVPRGNVSANVNPTTGYYSSTNSTLRLPNGVSVTPRTDITPVVSKYSGGLQQTIPTSVTIDAIKKTAPLPTVVRSSTQSVKNAAKRFLGSPKANLAFMAGSVGLQALLDGVDWVMGEGGQITKNGPPSTDDIDPSHAHYSFQNERGYTFEDLCNSLSGVIVGSYTLSSRTYAWDVPCYYSAYLTSVGPPATTQWPITINYRAGDCPAGAAKVGNNCIVDNIESPVSSADISSTVDQNYVPDSSDWRALAPHLELDDVEITSAPTLQGEPKTTTVYDANGNPISVTETNTWFDFDVRDNPSKQPAVDLKTRTETKTYENGALTGTTTTENTDSAGSGSAGSGGAPAPDLDIPTDCDFHPTLCAWMDWTKQNDLDEDPDLTQIMHEFEPTNTDFSVTGSKSCPAPYSIHIGLVNRTYELSFEPACIFAGYLYFLVMAGAYIFAAYITLGVARNG